MLTYLLQGPRLLRIIQTFYSRENYTCFVVLLENIQLNDFENLNLSKPNYGIVVVFINCFGGKVEHILSSLFTCDQQALIDNW